MLEYQLYKLKNELKVLMIPNSKNKQFCIQVTINAGFKDSNEKYIEVPHFLEHMISDGSTKKYTNIEIKNLLTKISNDENAETLPQYTKYYIHTVSQYQNTALDILYQQIVFPLFLNSEIKLQTNIIKQELQFLIDNNEEFAKSKMNEYLFDNHPISWESGKLKHRIRTLHLIKKKQLLDYYNKYYIPNNMLLTLVGNFDVNKMKQTINNTFGKMKFKKNIIKKTFDYYKTNIVPLKLVKHNSKTVFVYYCFKYPSGNRLYNLYEKLISYVLVSGTNSILHNMLRNNNGLVYNVDDELNEYDDNNQFYIIKTETSKKNVKKLLQLINKSINNLKLNGITKQIYNNFIINTKINYEYNPISLHTYLDKFNNKIFNNKKGPLYSIQEDRNLILNNINYKKVNNFIKQLFNDKNRFIFICGNIDKI